MLQSEVRFVQTADLMQRMATVPTAFKNQAPRSQMDFNQYAAALTD